MNAKEQLISMYARLANVNETLSNLANMEAWEIKEYKGVRAEYLAEIERLENHIEQNKEMFK